MSAVSNAAFEPLDQDRKFLRTLAQLARLDPRMRVKEDESDLVHDASA
jgi:hypothetical protein